MFEYDPAKSESNRQKHGIDFKDAQKLWQDTQRLEVPALTSDEPRFLVIGRIGTKIWSAVCVMRGEKVRLISVRRARDKEIEYYESV